MKLINGVALSLLSFCFCVCEPRDFYRERITEICSKACGSSDILSKDSNIFKCLNVCEGEFIHLLMLQIYTSDDKVGTEPEGKNSIRSRLKSFISSSNRRLRMSSGV